MTWTKWEVREAKIKATVMINATGWQEFSRSDRFEYVPAPPDMGDLVGLWEKPAYHSTSMIKGNPQALGRQC